MHTRLDGNHAPFHVLFVCTANQCRSPIAEQLFLARVRAAGLHWTATSAGTHAKSGQPIHPLALRALAELDVTPPEEWAARRLSADVIAQADLVLTAGREHRAATVRMSPRANRHTFTLRQFARYTNAITPALPSTDGHALVAASHDAQSHLQPVNPDDNEITDPIGHSFGLFRACTKLISASIDDIFSSVPVSVRPSG